MTSKILAQGPKTLTAEGPLSIKANSLQTKDVRSLVIKWAPHSLRKEETSSPSVRSLQTPQLAPWPFESNAGHDGGQPRPRADILF